MIIQSGRAIGIVGTLGRVCLECNFLLAFKWIGKSNLLDAERTS